MSTTSIDSTNNTLTASTDWYAGPFGAGFDFVEVTNLDGAAAVSYQIASGTNNVSALGADHWVLPASVTAREHTAPTGAFYVSIVSAGTPQVLVTAW